jgi:glutamine phosphoribosylpyrophosphate amidotransferase
MLNEARSRVLRKLVVEQIAPGVTMEGVIGVEIARREDLVSGLMAQKKEMQDEIEYFKSLDAKELHKEVGDAKKKLRMLNDIEQKVKKR